ncbi:MAG TPA: ribosomal protein S18-alanine N-acetyltransferase [Lachnospiraceae bacterium]|nr:ribosomal protein S18-alanine N-acetyltransferase [Lachnospiraceae bacterium]
MITIEQMVEKDLEEVVQLEKDIFSDPWSKESFLSSITSGNCIYLVVRDAEELVAYCGMYLVIDEGQIANVAVRKEYRNQNIGATMLKKLMEMGLQKGAVNFTLEVRVTNLPAIHLYEKIGFTHAGIRKNFYEKPTEDAYIMWLYN